MKITGKIVIISLAGKLVYGHMRVDLPRGRSVISNGNDAYGAMGPSACGGSTNSQWQINSDWTDSMDWPISQDYSAGGIVEVGVTWSTSHDGHFRVELCDPSGETGLTNSCFLPLSRVTTDTLWSPYLDEYPYDFFVPDVACAERFTPTEPLIAKFQLPKDLTSCPHCVARVHYQTSNSCLSHPASVGCTYTGCGRADPRITAWSNADCKTSLSLVSNSCGTDCPNENCIMERFKICFDISIGGSDPNAPQAPPDIGAPALPVGGGNLPAPGDGEDPVAYCQSHLTSSYPDWITECQSACADYQVWCAQSMATSGDALAKCVMMINQNCYITDSLDQAPTAIAPPPLVPEATSSPGLPVVPAITNHVEPVAPEATPVEYCQHNIQATNPPMTQMCQGQCASLAPICTGQGASTGPLLLSCVIQFNTQCS